MPSAAGTLPPPPHHAVAATGGPPKRRVYHDINAPTSASVQSYPSQPGYPPGQSQMHQNTPINGMQPSLPAGYPPMQPGMPQQQQQQQQSLQQIPGMPPQPNMQPPQPTGMAPTSPPRPRINPDQIPSVVAVQEYDQSVSETVPFNTNAPGVPPLASSHFHAVDQGNCNPKFMRSTLYEIPANEEVAAMCKMPIALVIQPLAELDQEEMPVPVLDFGESGPIRCSRCKAYINPFVQFTDGGRRFTCNLCRHSNDVPEPYFYNLDMAGRRLDFDMRPELKHGTVEFIATKEFETRPAREAAYVFVVDVSWHAIQSGMLVHIIQAIKNALYNDGRVGEDGEPVPGVFPTTAKFGLVTFDRSVHFYNFTPTLDQAQMMVVPDVDDVFVPLSDGFLVDPRESRDQIEGLLDQLPHMFSQNRTADPAYGAAITAVQLALKDRGGRIFSFLTTLPLFGPGTLKNREDMTLMNTEKEKTLYAPQDTFYTKLAELCVDGGIMVDTFFFPQTYIDVATLGTLSSVTGGEIYYYPKFHADRDGHRVMGDIVAATSRSFGFDAVLRVRCVDGLRLGEHYGNMHMRNVTDVALAGVHSQTSVAVSFLYDGKLDERVQVGFQCALLYTTVDGSRRIRVHNLSLPATTSVQQLFRNADMDTAVNFLAKAACVEAYTTPLKTIREQLQDRCVKILTAYRRHCSTTSAPSQLILPDSYKLFPMTTLALLKSMALRGTMDVPVDMRITSMRWLKSMPVSESIVYLYPRVAALHNLPESAGLPDPKRAGMMVMPPLVRASYTRLHPTGVYVVVNTRYLWVWIGRQVSAEVLEDVFGVNRVEQVDVMLRELPTLANNRNGQARGVIKALRERHGSGRHLSFRVCRQSLDPWEIEFANLLVEDKNNGEMNYVDFLVSVHRSVQHIVSFLFHHPNSFIHCLFDE